LSCFKNHQPQKFFWETPKKKLLGICVQKWQNFLAGCSRPQGIQCGKVVVPWLIFYGLNDNYLFFSNRRAGGNRSQLCQEEGGLSGSNGKKKFS
jgi:hypothetical protein